MKTKTNNLMESIKNRNAFAILQQIKEALNKKTLSALRESRKQVAAITFGSVDVDEAAGAVAVPKRADHRSGVGVDFKPGKYGGKDKWGERMPWPKDYATTNYAKVTSTSASPISQFRKDVKPEKRAEKTVAPMQVKETEKKGDTGKYVSLFKSTMARHNAKAVANAGAVRSVPMKKPVVKEAEVNEVQLSRAKKNYQYTVQGGPKSGATRVTDSKQTADKLHDLMKKKNPQEYHHVWDDKGSQFTKTHKPVTEEAEVKRKIEENGVKKSVNEAVNSTPIHKELAGHLKANHGMNKNGVLTTDYSKIPGLKVHASTTSGRSGTGKYKGHGVYWAHHHPTDEFHVEPHNR